VQNFDAEVVQRRCRYGAEVQVQRWCRGARGGVLEQVQWRRGGAEVLGAKVQRWCRGGAA